MNNPQYFIFNERPELLGAPRTIICTGLGRSGTSAVMSLLEFLGVWVGAPRQSPNRENKELKRAIGDGPQKAAELIAKYNKKHRVWGFKAPSIRKDLAETLRMFRNPMVIVPHRDAVGKLGRQMISEDKDVTLQDIHRLIVSQRRLIEELKEVEAPQLHVAFPLLTSHPEEALKAVAEFAGLAIPSGDLKEHMQKFRNRYLGTGPDDSGTWRDKAKRVTDVLTGN